MTMKTRRADPWARYPHAKVFVENYLQNYKPEIFDTFNYEFAQRRGPGYDQGRAYNVHLYNGLVSGMPENARFMYAFGSISKGTLANGFVIGEKPVPVMIEDGTVDDGKFIQAHHVYDLKETIGSQNAVDKVFRGNKWMQMQKLGLLQTIFPDYYVLVPNVLQGAASFAGQPNFDLGAERRDNHYMQLWTPSIREKSRAFYMDGDWFFSGASGGLELPEAVAIAAGLRKRRPDADMRFLDINVKDVPLFEMNRRYAEYLFWAAKQEDFYLKHEPTALMRNFAISAMAERGQLPGANPVFLRGILDSADATRYLQKEIEPLMLERVAARYWKMNLTDLRDTNPDFVEKCEEAKKGNFRRPKISLAGVIGKLAVARIPVHDYSRDELLQGDLEYKEIAAKIDPSQYLKLTEADVGNRPMRGIDMAGVAAYAHDGRSLFSRRLLGDPNGPKTRADAINQRERMQAGIALGELETVMPPQGRVYYIAADDKLGPITEEWKDKLGLRYADEVHNVAGRKFAQQIRAPQRQMILDLGDAWRAQGRQVISAPDIQDRFALYGLLPEIMVAPGEAIPGSATRTLARHAFLARNVTDFCFKSGQWEQSNDAVQDMILATRMQLGLESGSQTDPKYVRVFDEKGRCLTVAQRFEGIWDHLEKAIDKGRDPVTLVEPVTALAQLRGIHRILSDHTMRQHLFEKLREQDQGIFLPAELPAERINMFMSGYDHKAFEDLWAKKVRPEMERSLALAVRLRHLEHIEDFASMRMKQEATLAIAVAGRPEDRSIRNRTEGSILKAS